MDTGANRKNTRDGPYSKPTVEEFCKNSRKIFMPTLLDRIRKKQDAEDIYQEAIARLIPKYDRIDDPERYIWKTIDHLRVDNLRQKKIDSVLEPIDHINFGISIMRNMEHDEITSYAELETDLSNAINSFPPDKHKILVGYLLTPCYDPILNKYRPQDAKEYCLENDITKSYFYKIIAELTAKLKTSFNR